MTRPSLAVDAYWLKFLDVFINCLGADLGSAKNLNL
jgi:hypothetical protein